MTKEQVGQAFTDLKGFVMAYGEDQEQMVFYSGLSDQQKATANTLASGLRENENWRLLDKGYTSWPNSTKNEFGVGKVLQLLHDVMARHDGRTDGYTAHEAKALSGVPESEWAQVMREAKAAAPHNVFGERVAQYGDIKQAARAYLKAQADRLGVKHPTQKVVLDGHGEAVFQGNPIVVYLLDHGPFDMNSLARLPFEKQDREQFAQLIGYSVEGFSELDYVSDGAREKADDAANGLYLELIGDMGNDN